MYTNLHANSSSDGRLGVIVPVYGIVEQRYHLHLYKSLLGNIPKVMITFWQGREDWFLSEEEHVLLQHTSFVIRVFDRLLRLFTTRRNIANQLPDLPLGWKHHLRRVIRERNISALLIIYAGTGAAMITFLEKEGIPFAVQIAGSEAQMGDQSRGLRRRLMRLWQCANKCIFVSNFLLKQAVERGCDISKSIVIYNSVSKRQTVIRCRENSIVRFICVASLLPVKGHAYLLKAFAQAMKDLPNIYLTLIGKGPTEESLRLLAKKLGIEQNIRFAGLLPHETVLAELDLHDIYVQPSIRDFNGGEEGLCIATIEAQAHGLPAIVFNSGGLPEVVEHNQTGFVVTEKDVEALTDAMKLLAQAPYLRNEMGRSAVRRTNNLFDDDKQAKLWQTTMNELLSVLKEKQYESR